jgi:predicted permease
MSVKGESMDTVLRDIRFGVRSLLRDKGYTITVISTLAICFAAYTATFAIVRSVLLRPLPGPHAEAIVLMSNQYPKAGVTDQSDSAVPDYFDRLRAVTALDEQAMFQRVGRALEVNGSPEQVPGMAVTPSFFKLLGIAPARGRAFTPEEGEVGSEHKVILSHALWQQLFGGDPGAIGRELRLAGAPFTVVGIMPRDFVFLYPEVRFWVPLAFTAQQKTQYHSNNWCNIGRLKPGATLAQVQAQVNALNTANLERFPEWKNAIVGAGFYTRVEPLQRMLVKGVASALYLLWGGAAFVLLIGGLNIANLGVARWSMRGQELATRLALGAGRVQLSRQLIAENVLLAGTAGSLGVLGGVALLRGVNAIGLDRFPRAQEVHIDAIVALVAMGLAVAVGVLAGLVPVSGAFQLDVSAILRDGGRTGTGGTRTRRLREALVGVEIGLALMLLAGAGLLLASFRHLLTVDPGFTSKGVVTASTSAPQSRYHTDGDLRILMNRSLASIRRLPGVAAAGATTVIPLGGNYGDSVILAEGHEMKPGESMVSPYSLTVTPGYFETMNIALVRGRYFDEGDNENAPPVIIVDERLARHFWPDRDPIGLRMYKPMSPKELYETDAHTRWFEVVGVVRSVRLEDLTGTRGEFGAYYFPYAQNPSRFFTLAARTTRQPESLARPLRTSVAQVDPELALFDLKTMTERTEISLSARRTSLILALGFGGLALFLSATGIYGVLAYLVGQRRREIAIRVALGSTRAGIVKVMLREAVVLVAIGSAVGLAGAAGLHRVVANQIYGIGPLDPILIGALTLLLGTVALAGCALPPLVRALRIEPAIALREQ